MPPRVAYWCSSFDADIEAIGKEVAALREAFPGSVTWGVAARDWVRVSRRHGYGIHARGQLLFRGLTWLAQKRYDVQHLFGSLSDWFHLRAVQPGAVVLTMAVDTGACDRDLLAKVDQFVVEWPGAVARLESLGIGADRVRVIYPPVDLQRFQTAPPPEVFTVLFASSPERAGWLRARGVDALLDAAQECPEFRFVLVWRPWGEALATVQQWIADRGLKNVELRVGKFAEMARQYQSSHVIVAAFRDGENCKPAPNSVVEGLACGRPAVVTRSVGLAEMIEAARAGVVCEPDGNELAASLRRIAGDWGCYSERARRVAEEHFSHTRFIEQYRQVYSDVLKA